MKETIREPWFKKLDNFFRELASVILAATICEIAFAIFALVNFSGWVGFKWAEFFYSTRPLWMKVLGI